MFKAHVNETGLQSCVPNYPLNVVESAGNNGGNDLTNLLLQEMKFFSIAPGKRKYPVHFMQDKHCEGLAFPI